MHVLLASLFLVSTLAFADDEFLHCNIKGKVEAERDGECEFYGNLYAAHVQKKGDTFFYVSPRNQIYKNTAAMPPLLPPGFDSQKQLIFRSFALSKGMSGGSTIEACEPVNGQPLGTCQPSSLKVAPIGNSSQTGIVAVKAKVSIQQKLTLHDGFRNYIEMTLKLTPVAAEAKRTAQAICQNLGLPWAAKAAQLFLEEPAVEARIVDGMSMATPVAHYLIYPFGTGRSDILYGAIDGIPLDLVSFAADGQVSGQTQVKFDDVNFWNSYMGKNRGSGWKDQIKLKDGDTIWAPVSKVVCN